MKTKFFLSLFASILMICLPVNGTAVESSQTSSNVKPKGRDAPLWNQGAEKKTTSPPIIKTIGEGMFLLDNITINKPEGYVSVKGVVNMDEGLLEYLACGTTGKLHESLFMIDVNPYYFQISLLLIGLEPGDQPLKFQGAPGIPQGDPVEIWISWKENDKKMVLHRAEELIFNQAKQRPMKKTHWVFTGSQILDGRFMAQVEQSIAATFHDPFAIIDHPLPSGADDTLYVVNKKTVPARGTPVTFMVKAVKRGSE